MSFNNGPTIVTDGLVLALDAGDKNSYPGSGTTWSDLVGGNNGTLTNGPTFNTGSGGSIVFDGVNDYTQTSIGATMPTNFTVDIWVKPNSSQVQYADIVGNHGQQFGVTTWGFVIQQNNLITNQYSFSWGYGSPAQFAGGGFWNLTSNIWTNITVIKNGVSGYTYLNGSLVDSFTGSYSTIGTSPLGIMIGTGNIEYGQSSPQGRFFNGNISNVKLYDRPLSSTEILQNYNATKGRFNL